MLEFLEQLKNTDHLTALHVVVLLAAGFGVGFVNTIAGSGTIVSYSVFMFFGVPANFANGTIRLGVVMQTLAASYHFYKKQLLNLRTGLRYALPIAVGSVVGAQIAVEINQLFFEKIIAAVILFMVVLMLYNPERWIQSGGQGVSENKWWHVFIYFTVGIYGGFVHIGVGLFLLAAFVLLSGYNLVEANGLKVYTVFIYSPLALLVYVYHQQINYELGLIAAVGNLVGGVVASRIAVKKGSGFVRWFVIIVALLYSLKLFGFFGT